jgi:osmotically-inducible protein OsmY
MAGHPIRISLEADGTLSLEGEVASVAAKKLTLERAAVVAGVSGIIDRLHVTPAALEGDGEIRDHVRDALLQEPAFRELAFLGGSRETARSAAWPLPLAGICIRR